MMSRLENMKLEAIDKAHPHVEMRPGNSSVHPPGGIGREHDLAFRSFGIYFTCILNIRIFGIDDPDTCTKEKINAPMFTNSDQGTYLR